MTPPDPTGVSAGMRPIAWRVRTTPGRNIEFTLVAPKGEASLSRTFDPGECADIAAAIHAARAALASGHDADVIV